MITAELSDPEEDPESQVVPWANNSLMETEVGPEDEVLPQDNSSRSFKRKRTDSEPQDVLEISDAEDNEEEAVMRPDKNADDGIDMEMDLGEESNASQSAVRLTTQVSPSIAVPSMTRRSHVSTLP